MFVGTQSKSFNCSIFFPSCDILGLDSGMKSRTSFLDAIMFGLGSVVGST